MAKTQNSQERAILPRIRELLPKVYQELLPDYNTSHRDHQEVSQVRLEKVASGCVLQIKTNVPRGTHTRDV